MKTIIATAALALSFAAPAAADISTQQFFALSNDSAAERIVSETSTGDVVAAAKKFALTNDSVAETTVNFDRARSVDVDALKKFFAMGNDSAAEI
ncbi:hypothetical protein [uncultured Litoreibacter sp.]|uniref:hypothetical protein n=1 Tax=uncultured Litoreibacter sp. TaxID=1392394 RepID=UPI002619628A|nr:hypothetical protein [uncultured Litoreibacter sp.]